MSKKSVVCHIITGLSVGGAERALYNLLSGGLSDRFETHVISLSDAGHYGSLLADAGVPVHCIGLVASKPHTLSRLNLLHSIIRRLAPDIIQGWMYHGNLAAWLAQKTLDRKPSLAWNIRHSLHDPGLEPIQTRVALEAGKFLSRAPQAILYNSKRSRELHERWGFRAAQGRVIPNGFDLVAHSPDPHKGAALRARLGIEADAFVFGHLARLHPMKDHLNFLQAAMTLCAQHPKSRFLLAGTGVSEVNPPFSTMPQQLKERCLLLGERNDVADLLQCIDVLVLSSAWGDAFPNVLGEAMACAVPCIATDVGDCDYIIGDTGLIVPPRSSSALAIAMRTTIENLDQTRRWGQLASERVTRHFSLDNAIEQYTSFYNGELA